MLAPHPSPQLVKLWSPRGSRAEGSWFEADLRGPPSPQVGLVLAPLLVASGLGRIPSRGLRGKSRGGGREVGGR